MSDIRSVLITGASGRIGRDLCHRLDREFEVRAGVRREVNDLPNPVMCQLREFDSVRRAVEGVDAVVHLAGQAWERDIYEQMIPDNITGCYNIYEASKQAGVKRVIFASTNHVVGKYLDEGTKVGEDVACRPDTFYAVTKIYGEALGRLYAERDGLSVICVRIGWFMHPERLVQRLRESPERRHHWVFGIWISPRDMAQFTACCLRAQNVHYEILNCASDNACGLQDISRAKKLIGYTPQDSVEALLREAG
jgi:uronate dehydrogenase